MNLASTSKNLMSQHSMFPTEVMNVIGALVISFVKSLTGNADDRQNQSLSELNLISVILHMLSKMVCQLATSLVHMVFL